MSDFDHLSDHDIEALLGGSAAPGHEGWSAVVDRIRREAAAPIDPATAEAQVTRAARVAAGTPAQSPRRRRTSRTTWRRRTVFTGLLSTLIGKLIVGTAAVAIAAAGAGAAGVLPDPLETFMEQNLIGEDAADEITKQIRIRQQERVQIHIDDETPVGDQVQNQHREQSPDDPGGDHNNNQGDDPGGDHNNNQGDDPGGNHNNNQGDDPGGNQDRGQEQDRSQQQSGELDRDRDQDQTKHQDNAHQGDPNADRAGSDPGPDGAAPGRGGR